MTDAAQRLTEKQRRWIEFYMGEAVGNATEAARLAEYKGSNETLRSVGHENLMKPNIAIEIQRLTEEDPAVATRIARQRFWSAVMLNADIDMKDRLRASELLGKSQIDFVERKVISGDADNPLVVQDVAQYSSAKLRQMIAAEEAKGDEAETEH